jgi:site-specific DNA-methyltransferase (adenine-specific)
MSPLLDIHNMDCLDLMCEYPDNYFDLAVVDPPYRDKNDPTKCMRSAGSMKSLEGRPNRIYWNELFRVSKEQIIWGANNFQLPQFKGFIIWDKVIPINFTMSMAEIASLSEGLSTISKILSMPCQKQDRIHPTQKPVEVYDWIFEHYAERGMKVLDTHMGSGSIAIAAHHAGIYLTACEIDSDYYAAACERIQRETRQVEFSFA